MELFQLGRVRLVGWQRLSYGLHVREPWPGERDQLRAWRAVLPPEAVLTHLTAAALRGWGLPHPVDHPVFLALPADISRPRRQGLSVSRHREPVPSVLADGLRVALAADTLLAAARDLGDLDLVALADCALHRNHSTLDQVRAVAGQRRQGARRLRAVIPLLDGRSESPWESVLRILHRAADIEVEPQYKIVDDEGAFVARVDLWLVGTQRVHEYDGAVHREASVHQQDLSREGAMVQIGWQRIGFTSRHLLTRGASIIAGADQLLGRSWDPRRLAAWNRLLAESVCTASGRARLRSRWARSTYSRRPPAQ